MKKRLIHSALLSTLLLGIIAEPTLGIQRILAEEVVEEKKKEGPKETDDSNEKESDDGHTENGQTQHADQEKNSEEKAEKQSKHEKVSKSFELAPQGNVNKHRDEEYRVYQHSNKIPTGLYVENTESFTVTTDKNNTKIIIGQYGTYDYLNNNEDIDFTTYELEVGENRITFEKGTGMIYLQNFSEEEPAQVTIEDTLEVPTFHINETTTEEWKEQMTRLTDAPFVELVGDYVFGTFQYNQAEDFLNPDTVNDRLKYWDQVFLYQNEVIGTSLTGTGINKKYNNRVHIINPDTGGGWANAGGGRLSFHKAFGAGRSILSDLPEQDQWGFWHEMGHTYQNPYYKASFLGEVTVNIPAHVIQNKLGLKNRFEGSSNVARIQSFIETSGNKSFAAPGYDNDSNHWIWLGLFEQLRRAYGNNFYSHLNYNYRLLDNVPIPSDDEGKFQLFMKMSSQTTQRDLSEFFEKWGLYPNQDTLEEMKKYSKPSQPIWENIYNGTIVDEELPLLKVPQAEKTPGDYVLGTVPAELKPTTFFTNVKDSAGNPADQSMNYLWNITNPASKGKILSAKIEDSAGNKNKFSPLETNFKYGNALSMNAYSSEERIIITLQKTSKTIEAFSDETKTTQLNTGNGEYVRFVLYNNKLQAKKEVVANAEDTPFDFVKNASDLPYEEGDYIKMTIRDAKKLESYTNSEISMSRSDSTKEEWFRIQNDAFERVDYAPHGTPVEVTTTIGQEVKAEDFVTDISDSFDASKVTLDYIKAPNTGLPGEQEVIVELTNIAGKKTSVKSKVTVNHDTDMTINGKLTKERIFITLQDATQTIEAFTNELDTSPIDVGSGIHTTFTLFDSTLDVKKEAVANEEDTPEKFVNSLKNIPYKEGDWVKVTTHYTNKISTYHEGTLTLPSSDTTKEEWFRIENNSFEHVDHAPHGTPVEVETPIGQKVDAKALVQDIADAFDPEDIQVTFEKEPNVNKSGDVTASLLLTNKMGYQTKLQSIIHVGHGNALSLRAYAVSDERAVIRLDKDKQTIETFANPDRQTPIDGSNGLAWRVTLYDGKTNAVKKEVSAQREDLPFDFATSLSNVSYENGDYIKLYNQRSGFTFNYRDNEQTDETFGTDEYLVIQNNQFVKMTNEVPTLQSEDTISYERGMLISPEQFLEDIQAKTQAGNQLTTSFDENTLKEVGVVQVEVKATNPISQEEVSKTVTVTVTPSTLAYNEYKRSYWRDYGFVLEGNAGIQDTAFPSKDSVTKVLEILDAKGQIVDTVQAVNTNWYESLNYSGYQVNISYTKLQALEAGNYSLQMHLTSADGLDEVLPITSPLNLFGWTGEFQDDMSQIASGFAGKNVLNFTETNRSLGLTVTYGDAVFNKLSQYTAASGNHVIDGWIATDFDFQTTHTKELVVEDANGNEVLRKTAPTWDITQTFKVDVKEEWKRSGFQASIPADKVGNGNKYFIEIKDGQGNEVTKTEVK